MASALILPLVMAGLGAAGGALSNRKSQTKVSPEYTPEQTDLMNKLIAGHNQQMQFNPQFFEAYRNQGLKKIGKSNAYANELVQNMLTARGLSRTSGGTSTIFNSVLSGLKDKANFAANLPLLQRQDMQQNLQNAGAFFSTLKPSTVQENPGNVLGGLFTGAASGLGAGLGMTQANKQSDILTKILQQNQTVAPIPTLPPPGPSTGYGRDAYGGYIPPWEY